MTEIIYPTLELTPERIGEFISDFARRSRSKTSVSTYQRRIEQFYALLPPDKIIRPGMLAQIRAQLIDDGVPNRSINVTISAVNSLLDYFGRRDLQLIGSLEQTAVIAPELTRAEYLRLLMTAKALDKERTYLIVKVFANIGLHSRELALLTAEAVGEGRIVVPERGLVPIPPLICRELADYCRRNGRITGPVFATLAGKPIHRSAVNAEIRRLALDARVDEVKCNPITLRRLYLATQEQITANFAILIEQSHDRLLEAEQVRAGWEQR